MCETCVTRFHDVTRVTTSRTLQVMASVCGGIAFLLLIVCIASSYWLHSGDYRQGLWEECCPETTPGGEGECSRNDSAWIDACAALCVIALVIDLVALLTNGLGLGLQDIRQKQRLYTCAMVSYSIASKTTYSVSRSIYIETTKLHDNARL